MTPQETKRRIRQLDNEVGSIYEILSAIEGTQRRHSMRFQEQAQTLDRLEARFDGLETKVDGLEARFDGLETKVDGLETRFDGLEARFDGLETKVDLLTSDMGTVLEILRAR